MSLRSDITQLRLHIKESDIQRLEYALPTSSQVAAILVGGEDLSELNESDIIIQTQSGSLMNVPDTACYYDPLQYPMLLLYGSSGWDLNFYNDSSP